MYISNIVIQDDILPNYYILKYYIDTPDIIKSLFTSKLGYLWNDNKLSLSI